MMQTGGPSRDELLEQMLQKGENELFPKFHRNVNTFIETFNSSRIQNKVVQYLKDFEEKLSKIENTTSVFDMICSFREFLTFLEKEFAPIKLFKWLQQSGLFALVNDSRFNFLEENLSDDQRVERLLKIIDDGVHSESAEVQNQAFEEYIASWQENQRRIRKDQTNFEEIIKKEIIILRNQKKETDQITSMDIRGVINEVCQYFEPLRKKLTYNGVPLHKIDSDATRDIKRAGAASGGLPLVAGSLIAAVFFPPLGVPLLIGAAGAAATGAKIAELNQDSIKHYKIKQAGEDPIKFDRRKKKDWFDNTIKFITSFLLQEKNKEKNKEEFKRFLDEEMLEDDFEKFQECTGKWLSYIRLKTKKKNMFISKDIVNAEIDRMTKFMYAVVLNKPELIAEHTRLVNKLVRTAAHNIGNANNPVDILPYVSFGQLPLPGASNRRPIRFTFVLSSDESIGTANSILEQLTAMFPTAAVPTKEVDKENDTTLLHVDVDAGESLPALIAKNISRLSDLSIRAVLIGSFGLGGFRHAMNPMFNRIYGTEAAEGFMTTMYSGSLDRGGEPYFCPTGWRRYSIDVGKSAEEFERDFGDWPVAYHGTTGHFSTSILLNGLTASGTGCYLKDGDGCVYLSPSIEYSGHPRYAKVWKVKNKYVQMVLQVRVKKQLIFDKKPGTLPGAFRNENAMDPNFKDNNSLEWIIKWPPGQCIDALKGIIIYGLMLRVSDKHLGRLPQCAWWKQFE